MRYVALVLLCLLAMDISKQKEEKKVSRGGLILKKPLGRFSRISLISIYISALFIPLAPLGIKGSFMLDSSPEFCVSCHVMQKRYEGWFHSAHKNWATCTDCHLPQQTFATKLAGKLRDGLNHGYAYAFNSVPDPIRIKKHGAETVMRNCTRCHATLVSGIHSEGRKCWDCHRGLAHGY